MYEAGVETVAGVSSSAGGVINDQSISTVGEFHPNKPLLAGFPGTAFRHVFFRACRVRSQELEGTDVDMNADTSEGVAIPFASASDAIDPSRPHAARVYDYCLGGKDNFQVDRDAGDGGNGVSRCGTAARVNRAFMHRATRYLAENRGVHWGTDIIVVCGIPARNVLGRSF